MPRMTIAACHSLFGASSAPVASCLLLSDVPIRALPSLRNGIRCGNTSNSDVYLKSLQSIFGLIPRHPPDLSMRFGRFRLLSSSLLWRG
jgi:hypothetical protein